ncbi:MAG: ABC transporter ATP-binding protein [Betaproteobacteria bacterium RIFCSPLOWO2_02_67_12]|nr:MAG: ABC transporter ATP-binding protein [Betaproteobacteria bacterium RIFCSPLOWO2_02_67_12]
MNPTPADLIEISELHFSYAKRKIFRGLSLRIPRGKVVAILGASGSGKSTLLRLLSGQLRPDRGWIRVDGQVVHKLDTAELYALRRRMGMMFQSSGLFTDLSVYENIAFALREHYDLPEELIRPLVLMKLDAVGLRGARDMMPADLSGGMTRRVALARAIATLIRKLNDALATTSILVTYDVSEALEVVDYLYVIADGVLVGEGTPQDVLASDDPYLKQFLHALPDGPVRFHFPGHPLAADLRLPAV